MSIGTAFKRVPEGVLFVASGFDVGKLIFEAFVLPYLALAREIERHLYLASIAIFALE